MLEVHKMKCEKYRHSMDETSLDTTIMVKPGPGTPQSQNQPPYSGRYDYVMKDLMSITNGSSRKTDLDESDNGNSLPPEAKRIKLDGSASNMKQCNICFAVFHNNIGLSNHMRSHTNPDAADATLIDVNANSNDGNLVIDLKKDELETDLDDSQSGKFFSFYLY